MTSDAHATSSSPSRAILVAARILFSLWSGFVQRDRILVFVLKNPPACILFHARLPRAWAVLRCCLQFCCKSLRARERGPRGLSRTSITAAARLFVPRLVTGIALEKIGPAPSAGPACGLVALLVAVEAAIVCRAVVENAPGGRCGIGARSGPADQEQQCDTGDDLGHAFLQFAGARARKQGSRSRKSW